MTKKINSEIKTFYSKDWGDYELLDTGEGEKLERFGKYVFARPYEDAVWSKTLTKEVQENWKNIDYSSMVEVEDSTVRSEEIACAGGKCII